MLEVGTAKAMDLKGETIVCTVTWLLDKRTTDIKTPPEVYHGSLIGIINYSKLFTWLQLVWLLGTNCNSIKLNDINCRTWRILTEIPLGQNTVTSQQHETSTGLWQPELICMLCVVSGRAQAQVSCINTGKCQDQVITWHPSTGHLSLNVNFAGFLPGPISFPKMFSETYILVLFQQQQRKTVTRKWSP